MAEKKQQAHKITGLSQGVKVYRHTGLNRGQEWIEQKAAISWFDYNFPQWRLNLIHVPNETQATDSYQKRLNSMGRRAGCSDLLFLVPMNGYPYACIEFKAKNGTISGEKNERQRDFMNHHYEQGAFCAIVHGCEAFKKMICEYCNIDPV